MVFTDSQRRFKLSWVLVEELAVGSAPREELHLEYLEAEGIKAVLSLSSHAEASLPEQIEQRFKYRRFVLPDHKADRLVKLEELQEAITILHSLWPHRPVFVHCVASMERSPLICIAWLMQQKESSQRQALDYLMQIHPGTRPLAEQLLVLNDFTKKRLWLLSMV